MLVLPHMNINFTLPLRTDVTLRFYCLAPQIVALCLSAWCVGRYKLPSQQHFYMEPQGALVLPDEDGTFTVTSSTQNIDAVQKAVAEVLNLPMHKITAGQLLCTLLAFVLLGPA